MAYPEVLNPKPGSRDYFELVYDELRKRASAQMSREYAYSTLQGTALVHEAWLRLGGDEQPLWKNRAHFFAVATRAMRRVLLDRARKRMSERHGGKLKRARAEDLETLPRQIELDDEFLRLNEAIDRFATRHPRKAEVVKLRYFFGFTFEETAQILGVSIPTAHRWWAYARSWLFDEISIN